MKFIAFAVALFCAVAYVTAEFGEEQLLETYNPVRFRREANPQGSVVIKGEKPLSGPDRRPSLDVDYQQRVFDKNGLNANAYGGLNVRPGQPAQPHVGLNAERRFKDGFIGGFGQVQRGTGGRPSPTFGINGGFRFRRDVDEVVEQGEEE